MWGLETSQSPVKTSLASSASGEKSTGSASSKKSYNFESTCIIEHESGYKVKNDPEEDEIVVYDKNGKVAYREEKMKNEYDGFVTMYYDKNGNIIYSEVQEPFTCDDAVACKPVVTKIKDSSGNLVYEDHYTYIPQDNKGKHKYYDKNGNEITKEEAKKLEKELRSKCPEMAKADEAMGTTGSGVVLGLLGEMIHEYMR